MYMIKRNYHFYAAHRNENLDDKCRNIHGHTYRVEVTLRYWSQNDDNGVTILFSEIDKKIDPILKPFDHSFMINVTDPLLPVLKPFSLNIQELDFVTSCENLAAYLYTRIAVLTTLPIIRLTLKETDSSEVTYEPPV